MVSTSYNDIDVTGHVEMSGFFSRLRGYFRRRRRGRGSLQAIARARARTEAAMSQEERARRATEAARLEVLGRRARMAARAQEAANVARQRQQEREARARQAAGTVFVTKIVHPPPGTSRKAARAMALKARLTTAIAEAKAEVATTAERARRAVVRLAAIKQALAGVERVGWTVGGLTAAKRVLARV